MQKLCIIYNFAQKYRQPIFSLIDRTWDCEWYFGNNTTDIKGMDPDALRNTTYVENRNIAGPIVWQSGIGSLIRRKDLDTFIMLGEPMCLSTWWVLLQRRLFQRNKRVYLWTHGWYGREGFLKKWLKRAFFGLADHVFTYGEYAREQAITQGFDGDKITPIHNSLNHEQQVKLRNGLTPSDTYERHFGNQDPTLIFIGRLTKVKKLDQILTALSNLRERGHNYNLVLIGSGEEHKHLEQLTSELNLTDRVWFYGACYDDNQNAQLIYDADLCVAPGNVGLTAMHTMVFGTPVLTHNDFPWQMPEFEAIRPGETGAFFERDNIASLEKGISEWFASHPDRDAVRRACYNEIDTKWSPDYQLDILKKIIE